MSGLEGLLSTYRSTSAEYLHQFARCRGFKGIVVFVFLDRLMESFESPKYRCKCGWSGEVARIDWVENEKRTDDEGVLICPDCFDQLNE